MNRHYRVRVRVMDEEGLERSSRSLGIRASSYEEAVEVAMAVGELMSSRVGLLESVRCEHPTAGHSREVSLEEAISWALRGGR